MDENTRFLIKRMDMMEARIMSKIDALDQFRAKIIGGSLAISFIVSVAFELIMRR
jgi:hypothetical protein